MVRIEELTAFLAVARLGSFGAAASELGVPKSTVSRRVSRLERDIGRALIVRDTAGAHLTAAGRWVRSQGTRVVAELACLTRDADRPPASARLAISPELASAPGVLRALRALKDEFPDSAIEVLATNRRIDLAQEDIDVVLRFHLNQLYGPSDLMTKSLGFLRGGIYAAPAWAGRNEITEPRSLTQCEVVSLRGGSTRNHWPLQSPQANENTGIDLQTARLPQLQGSHS